MYIKLVYLRSRFLEKEKQVKRSIWANYRLDPSLPNKKKLMKFESKNSSAVTIPCINYADLSELMVGDSHSKRKPLHPTAVEKIRVIFPLTGIEIALSLERLVLLLKVYCSHIYRIGTIYQIFHSS